MRLYAYIAACKRFISYYAFFMPTTHKQPTIYLFQLNAILFLWHILLDSSTSAALEANLQKHESIDFN